jgi:predicted DNA-binding ribbon-helix-helix protein
MEDSQSQSRLLVRAETSLVSRNLVISGRRTTVRLADETWASFKDVAKREDCSIDELARRIHSRKRSHESFTSAIRVFLMLYYRDASTEAGHAQAGHGRL